MGTLAPKFDYAALDTEARVVVKQKTTEIRDRMKRAASDIVAIGERLIAVRDILPNQFSAWLKAEFDLDRRTAYNMIAVAERFSGENFSQLNIAPSALYLLASPSIPPVVREAVLSEAKEGKQISHADVKQRVEATRSRTCDACGSQWMSGEPECPYCNKSANERIAGLDEARRIEKSLDEQCADENEYLESIGMGGGEPAAPKRVNIKRAGEDEDDVPATMTLERKVEHVTAPKSRVPAAIPVVLSSSPRRSAEILVTRFDDNYLRELVAEIKKSIE